MAICPHCAAEIDEGARFCGECGRPITPTAAASRAAATTREGVVKPSAALPTIITGGGSGPIGPPGGKTTSAPGTTGAPGTHAPLGDTILAPPSELAGAARKPPPASPPVATSTPITVASAPAARAADAGSNPSRPAAPPLETLVGRVLNHRYEVGEKIGEGGFGAVFRGKQLATGRPVALKILHPHNVSDETIVARFRREAEACSKLRDPHTVTTYDFDETPDGILYLAMELLRGNSLHHVQKTHGPLPTARVLRIMDQVAASLFEAHGNGIVHRDMKPENVFIETREGADHVKVLDFGIAKVMSDERPVPALTAVGQTLGTLEFMSPEQLRGQALDGRSDLYALGMMAYEMLTGGLPFQSGQEPDRHHQLPHEGAAAPAVGARAEPSHPGRRRQHHPQDGREGPRGPLRRRERAARGDRARPALTGPDTGSPGGLPRRHRHRRRHRRRRSPRPAAAALGASATTSLAGRSGSSGWS